MHAQVHDAIRRLYQHPTKLFPSQQPQSIDRTTLPLLFKDPSRYVVSQKANGIHMTLLLARLPPTNTPVCCLMDRCNTVTFYQVTCLPELFDGSLFTGELIASQNTASPIFWAFDSIAYRGTSLLKEGYLKRLAAAEALAADSLAGKFSITSIDFRCKPCYKLFDFLGSFNPLSDDDGLIFMPVECPLTRSLPFKWKQQHTVDLLLHARGTTPGNYCYRVLQPAGMENVLQLDVHQSALLRTTEDLLVGCNTGEYQVVVECLLDTSHDRCTAVPVRFRHDKNTANASATVVGTMRSANEHITQHELVQLLGAVNN